MAVHVAFAAPAWDCRECNEELSRLRNCRGDTNPAFRTVIAGQVLRRCPAAVVTGASRRLVRRWQRMRFFGGAGLYGPPERTTEFVAQAMETIEAAATQAADDEGAGPSVRRESD